jgi:transposase
MPDRKPYPSDVSDDEWAFVAPYLALLPEEAGQRRHDLRSLLRVAARRASEPTAVVLDSRTLQSTPASGARAGYDGAKRRRGSKVHAAVDTLGHLLALVVTPADAQDRAQVERLARAVQEAVGETVQLAYVDQGYTGEEPAAEAVAHGIRLEVV